MQPKVITHIKLLLGKPLPGIKAHQLMLPSGRELDIYPEDFPDVKQSAVLFLLFRTEEGVSTCLIKRPDSMKDHAGQYAFPGGKYELTDPSVEYTALRESKEEVGIAPGNVHLLGQLSPLYISVSQFLISPVVGYCPVQPQFTLNPSEVESLILVPIASFLDEKSISEMETETQTGKLTVPCYSINGEVIWGATAMIISEFIQMLEKGNLIEQIRVMSIPL